MSSQVSEPGGAGTPATNITQISPEPFVQEFLRLVDEGWKPDLHEFVDRVPEAVREQVFQALDESIEQRTEPSWEEPEESDPTAEPAPAAGLEPDSEPGPEPALDALDDDHVLRQAVLEESPDAILAAAMGESEEPPTTIQVAQDSMPLASVIALGETYDLDEERFAPAAADELVDELVDEAVLPEPDAQPDTSLTMEDDPVALAKPAPPASAIMSGMDVRQSLGRGSLGESFLGIDDRGDKKVVTVASVETPDKVLQRLYSEAAKVKALHVDQLVAIEETRQEPSGPIAIAPFIEGEPIDLAVMDLELDDRVRFLQLVIEALASAHAGGLLHLDLKPSNVLVTPDGDVRILNWGVGAAVMSVPERMAKLAGPEHYASPEHARRVRMNAASDIFSFGSLMYRVLTRKLPFPGGANDVIRDRIDACEPQALRLHDDRIPQELQDICFACLSRSPSDRPDAGALIANFDRYLVGSPVRLRPTIYRSILRRESRVLIAQAQSWHDQGFANDGEADALQTLGRRILAREEQWTHDRAHAPRNRGLVLIGVFLFALSSGLMVRFGYAHISAFAAFFPIAGVIALMIAAFRSLRGGDAAMGDSLLGGALLALAPAVTTILQRTALLDGAGPVAGLSWLQVAAGAGLVTVASIAMLYRRREHLYAGLACAAFVVAYGAAVGVSGYLGYGALTFLPLVLLLIVAQQFEAHDRFGWMRPFFLTGLAALTLVPLYAAVFASLTPVPGIELVMVGLVWALAVPFLMHSGSIALRQVARTLKVLVPGTILAGLIWHAAAASDLSAWIGVLALGVVLAAHGSLLRRPVTFAWGTAALLCTAAVPAMRGLATPWTLSLAIGGAGLFAALVVGFASGRSRST